MKKIILFFVFTLITIKSLGNTNDSIFNIYIQQDSIPNTISVVFENISNDTILLFANFEDFFTEFKRYIPGFRIFFYHNGQLFVPNWGELPRSKYKIAKGKIRVSPHKKVILSIDLPILITKKIDEDRYHIILELNYRYFHEKEKRLEVKYFKSEYFELKNRYKCTILYRNEKQVKYFIYSPSNHNMDEINAHTKTLEVHQLGLFNISNAKLELYNKEINRYKELDCKSSYTEENYGYSVEGYKK